MLSCYRTLASVVGYCVQGRPTVTPDISMHYSFCLVRYMRISWVAISFWLHSNLFSIISHECFGRRAWQRLSTILYYRVTDDADRCRRNRLRVGTVKHDDVTAANSSQTSPVNLNCVRLQRSKLWLEISLSIQACRDSFVQFGFSDNMRLHPT